MTKDTITGIFKMEDVGELNPLLHVLEELRVDHTKNDEILFHSGGPIGKNSCLLYTSPSPRDLSTSRMPSSA